MAEQHQSIEQVLKEVLQTHEASSIQQLDCDKVSDEQFEELGDAYMEKIHPGEAHVQMDAMMGGEGSESLASMHIQMGKNYLSCADNSGWGMMGSGMMGRYYKTSKPVGRWDQLETGYTPTFLHPIMGGTLYLLIAAALVALIRLLWKKGSK